VARSSLLLLVVCLATIPDRARAESPALPVVAVPFGCGLSFPVTQVHAVGTHVDNDVWAWDFRMPEGTPVVAALDGVVRLARGDSTEGGCDPALAKAANYVVLEHAGGIESQYLHFSKVVVQVGQQVRQGELLGYSGATGWACGPHLHFKVARPDNDGWNNPSIAARISGYGDPALGTRVSSPSCPAPSVIATGGAAPATTPAATGGALLPTALSLPETSASAPVRTLSAGAGASGASPPAVHRVSRGVSAPTSAPATGAPPLQRAPAAPPPATPSTPAPGQATSAPVHAAS
jgi:hypothetical protein